MYANILEERIATLLDSHWEKSDDKRFVTREYANDVNQKVLFALNRDFLNWIFQYPTIKLFTFFKFVLNFYPTLLPELQYPSQKATAKTPPGMTALQTEQRAANK